MNKKGQALVEFIIIMPVLIMIILAIFDYARIVDTKLEMENYMDNIVSNKSYTIPSNYVINSTSKDTQMTYSMSANVELSCPILVKFLKSPYEVKIERVVYE